jgi:pimeloyl-ACP methyl ester carboxylesterase
MMIEVDGVELHAETFGDPADPPILLIMGIGSSGDYWEPAFCEALTGRYVIRYDHRDTGRSVSYPPGKPGYRAEALISDAVGVLDALGLAKAHIVGISMGGAIAQELVLGWPDRVSTLTLMSTTAGFGDPDLPGVDPRIHQSTPEPDWTDRAAVIEYLVADLRLYASTKRPFDEAAAREVATIVAERTRNPESAARNHYAAPGGGGSWRHRLPEITAPTLVLHGTDDPLFPLPHGVALAREIPHARLVELPDTGHEITRADWPTVVREVLAHTS